MDARTSANFPFSTGNTLFEQIWPKKFKIVSLSWNLVPRLTRICRTQWWFHFFCFRRETHFSGKFGPKNQNCQFNTLTANEEYSHSNRENLPLPIQMQLSENPKIFCCIFIAFLESTWNFEHFEKKNEPPSLSIKRHKMP